MNLRQMEMSDANFMLELKNDPDTRHFALLTSEEIKKEDHYKYLEENLKFFQVIEDGGTIMQKVGAVRVQDNEVSIWIAAKFRRCGYAKSILKKVRKDGMVAKIVCANIPSIRAFIRADFLPIELKYLPLNHYIFQFKAEIWAQE